jgi:D-alanine-D-alanine ligase
MRVLLLCGGESVERNVSLASGNSVADWLIVGGHEVTKYDPEEPGVFHFGAVHLGGEEIGLNAPTEVLRHGFNTATVKGLIHAIETVRPDVVFPVLHGGTGEDGTVQSLLSWIGIPYTGSGPRASQIAMNKDITRRLLKEIGIPVAEGFAAPQARATDAEWVAQNIAQITGYPAVIKPMNGGSTVGLTIVELPEEIADALKQVAAIHDLPLIEKYFVGREMTATVMDGECYPLIEIRAKDGFYDYANKYSPGRTEYVCPVELPRRIEDEIKNAAVNAFNVIGCAGVARIDFLVTDTEFICLEVNTIPGMTAAYGLVPKAAKANGVRPVELVQKLLDCALRTAGTLVK